MKRRAIVVVSLSLGLIWFALRLHPASPAPLYDGVVVQEPYRYLDPQQGQAGSPGSAEERFSATGSGGDPGITAATSESPPQAQLIAAPGAFIRGPTATVTVSIRAITPPGAPGPNSVIAGNVYRISVTTSDGREVAIDPSAPPTLVLRAPDGVSNCMIVRFDEGTWSPLPTQPVSGQLSMFLANPTRLGDFALLAPASRGLDPAAVVLIGMTLAIWIGLLVTGYRRWGPDRGVRR
ncbi:MAG TPA: hypothetical protein VIA82_05670 [Candidatus Limnocylindria bacterium]|jgi:hypothetical protein